MLSRKKSYDVTNLNEVFNGSGPSLAFAAILVLILIVLALIGLGVVLAKLAKVIPLLSFLT